MLAFSLMRARADAMLDPQVLLEVVRNSSGQIADFRYTEVNRATCDYLGLSREELLGRGVVETMPGIKDTLFPNYVRCLETGEPLALDDFSYDNEILRDTRRYDLRVTRATPTSLVLTWRDVTDRFNAAEVISRADERFRRSMDNATIGMCLIAPDGGFLKVNNALCELFGYDAETLMSMTWQELTAPEFLDAELHNVNDVLEGRLESYRMLKQYIHADGHRIWGGLSVSCDRDDNGRVENFISQITDVTDRVEAEQQLAASERNYRLIAENSGDVIAHIRDDRVVWVSPSVESVMGAPPDYWVGRDMWETVPDEEVAPIAARAATVRGGAAVQDRIRLLSADGTKHWFHIHVKPFYDADGHEDGALTTLRLIDDEVAAEQAMEEARRQQARSDERYRRSMETAAIGIGLLTPAGKFIEVNPALCRLLGYDAETLTQKTWQDLTPPEYLSAGQEERDALFGGRLDAYRIVKQYLHADGHRIWADVSVSSVRDENGKVETLAFQIADITATVEANQRNTILTERLEEKSQRLAAELTSAANYMASIMPQGLTGKVGVTSRYLPSRELGGDSFDYSWIDDDHLRVYLIDVSGHGLAPALLSASVHNMIRSGSLGTATLLAPEVLLTELNSLFQMEQQDDHYFTMWCGVYQASTRTLRYANAGSPPPFAFSSVDGSTISVNELSLASTPIGMFEDSEFTAHTYPVPPGCQILIYSDGASEITLTDNHQLKPRDFKKLVARVASSPGWSLDGLIDELHALSPSEAFDDDFSLIRLDFD